MSIAPAQRVRVASRLRALARLLVAMLAVVIGCSSSPAWVRAESPAHQEEGARDEAAAEQAALEAYLAYRRRDYVAAVAFYMKSQDAAPSPDVLFAIAHLYDTKLADRELATRFYRAFLAEASSDTEHVTIAEERLLALRASVESTFEPPAVELPDVAEVAPVAPERSAARAAATNAASPRLAPRRGLSRLQIGGVVLGAIGLASIGSGLGFGARARTYDARSGDECVDNRCTQRGLDDAGRARDFALVSTITVAAGGALAVAGATLAVWGRRSLRVSPSAQARLGTSLTLAW